MTKSTFSIIFTSFLIFSSSSIFAEEEQSYGSKIGNKALNGLSNIFTAVLEIPKNIINTTNDSNVAYGAVGGLAKGTLNTAGRLFSGVADLITFPIPTKPIAQPVYIWDDFDVDTTYGEAFRLDE
ncbi:MAG: exosortase system-associated protein, TIGR04073 family [Methylococcaceae bacterium]|nr:exosortase system-associated protein, TIGR04073 family [Methylococcaceae bacterium]